MRFSLIGSLLAILFVTGCEKKIYQKEYAKPSTAVTCLRLESDNLLTKMLLQKLYSFSQECPFVLKTTSHFISSCTSARAKALGSDFDGFLRLELFEKGKLLFRDQMDFKGCLDEEIVRKLFDPLARRYLEAAR